MPPATALIIGPDSTISVTSIQAVRRLGLEAAHIENAGDALQRLEEILPAVVILDLGLGGRPTQELLSRFTADGHVPVIAVVAAGNLRAGVEAMRAGSVDVLDERASHQEVEQAILAALPRTYSKGLEDPKSFGEIFGRGRKMQALLALVARLAAVSTPVLIRGESGVGKEVIAHTIHHLSDRSALSFVRLSCVALPGDRLEIELDGILGGVQHGTVFLDEIDEASATGQSQLLGILDFGGPKPRLIAATNADMYRLVGSGLFRRDLYERLAVATLDVPPLRERGEEIDSLAQRFLQRFAHELRRPVPPVSQSMAELLRTYDWPGNVRELENVIKRWVVLGNADQVREEIEARRAVARREHTAPAGARPGLREVARRAARDAERIVLQDALRHARGNRAAVARELKISYKTLLRKLTEAGLAATPKTR
jgi:DNA-binding NtrC family response regulator